MRTPALVLALLMSSLSVIADSDLDDFSSEKVLAGAVAEIQSMNLRQLEAAIEYIAACGEPPSTERSFHCGRNDSIASIKTAAAPHFTKLRIATFKAEKTIASEKDLFGGVPRHLMELRRIAVFQELHAAAKERYQKLTK